MSHATSILCPDCGSVRLVDHSETLDACPQCGVVQIAKAEDRGGAIVVKVSATEPQGRCHERQFLAIRRALTASPAKLLLDLTDLDANGWVVGQDMNLFHQIAHLVVAAHKLGVECRIALRPGIWTENLALMRFESISPWFSTRAEALQGWPASDDDLPGDAT